MPAIEVSIIIVNWNVEGFLRQCLASLDAAIGSLVHEVIVVDNNSADGSVKMVRAEFPNVKLVASNVNLGYAGGNNLGLEHASGEYVVILNPDTIPAPGSLLGLVNFLKTHPSAGLVGPKLEHPDGELETPYMEPPTALSAILRLPGIYQVYRLFGKPQRANEIDKPKMVFSPRGSCLVFSRGALLKVGGVPSQTFMYYEEYLIGHLMKRHGYQVWYLPYFTVLHFGRASTTKGFKPAERKVMLSVARIRAMKEMMPRSEFFLWNLTIAFHSMLRWLHSTLVAHPNKTYHLETTKSHIKAAIESLTAENL